ncbi:MAG: GNAT family N-acetyltransferase [Opitutales bacterium]|nr:GNAT family N-acetyltransferase [Opitutales bacterium]
MNKKQARRGWIAIFGILLGLFAYGILECRQRHTPQRRIPVASSSTNSVGRYTNHPSDAVQAKLEALRKNPYRERHPEMKGLAQVPPLGTDRLVLRGINSGDYDDFFATWNDRDAVYMLIYIPWPTSKEQAIHYLHSLSYQASRQEGLYWAITEPDAGRLMGVIGLTLESSFDRAELHYWLAKPYWGKGYATEAAKRVIDYVFRDLNIHRLEVNCFSDNARSKRVIEKCGFQHEYLRKECLKKEGQYKDIDYYYLLQQDYLGIQQE